MNSHVTHTLRSSARRPSPGGYVAIRLMGIATGNGFGVFGYNTNDFFKRYAVTFDFENMKIVLQ